MSRPSSSRSRPSRRSSASGSEVKDGDLDLEDNHVAKENNGSQRTYSETEALTALKGIHARKVKTLLKAQAKLEQELAMEKALQKDNIRIKVIRSLKAQVAELEDQLEAVKEIVGGADREQRIAAAVQAAMGGKIRRRPPLEVVEAECGKWKKRALRYEKQLKGGRATRDGAPPDTDDDTQSVNSDHSAAVAQAAALATLRTMPATDQEQLLIDLQEEVDLLRTQLSAKDRAIAAHQTMLSATPEHSRLLERKEEQLNEVAAKADAASMEVAQLRQELLDTVAENELFYQEIRSLQGKLNDVSRKAAAADASHAEQMKELQRELQQARVHDEQLSSQVVLLTTDLKSAQQLMEGYQRSADLAERSKQQRLNDVEQELQVKDDHYAEQRAALVKAHEQEVERLKKEMSSVSRPQDKLQIEELQKKVNTFRAQLQNEKAARKEDEKRHLEEKNQLQLVVNKGDVRETVRLMEDLQKAQERERELRLQMDTQERELARRRDEIQSLRAQRDEDLAAMAGNKQSAQEHALAQQAKQIVSLSSQASKADEEAQFQLARAEEFKKKLAKYMQHVNLLEQQMKQGMRIPPPRPS